MSYTASSPFISAPRISRDRFIAEFERVGSPWAPDAGRYYDFIVTADHDPAIWLAIGLREHRLLTDPNAVALKMDTKSLTNARSTRWPGLDHDIVTTADLRKAGITNRSGPYVRYRKVEDSLTDGIFRIGDPNYVYRKKFGARPTIGQVLSLWTEDDAAPYTTFVVGKLNEWNTGGSPVALTDMIAQRIRDKGREVHDIRGRMKRHATLRYDRLPNEAWIYTGVHHTAVSRGVRGLEGDIESWVNHSVYHVNTHGWPGIAYAIGISLSGRIFILRDIEEEGYHAFNANANTLAICGDLTTGNTITDEFKASLLAVLEVLHDAPEFPNLKDAAGTYGHQELAFIDGRNSGTACPGDLLPLVRTYRENGPEPDPNRTREFDTGYTLSGGFLAFYERAEASDTHWSTIGAPIGDEIPNVDNGEGTVTVQQTDVGWLQWTAATGEVRMAKREQAQAIRKALGIEPGNDVRWSEVERLLSEARKAHKAEGDWLDAAAAEVGA